MKVSYTWLQQYFETQLPPPKELADLLNIRAFEVEDIEEHNGDSILEIKVTPDRAPDCLSHLGIAREVSIHTSLPLKTVWEVADVPADFETVYAVDADPTICNRYMLREIKNVSVTESPLELKQKLESIGQRSINTIVDITNIVMYEIGQPMHAFDAHKIDGKVIKIAPPKHTYITTLDNREVALTIEDFTIQDAQDDLAIAGVKGGKKAEVNTQTTDIILESANFLPVHVRKTSKRTGIQTDSSKRFENGLTPLLARKALALASEYIQKYASTSATQFSNIIDVYPRPIRRPYAVGLRIDAVSQKLGVNISEEKILHILDKIGIQYKQVNVKESVLALVHETIGVPYKWGASVQFDSLDVFDCSSLTSFAYAQSGVQIPRISVDQFFFAPEIKKEELEPGDLIFANTGNLVHGIHAKSVQFLPGSIVEQGVDHVGIYIGDGKVLHAGSEIGAVAIESIQESNYFKNIVKYGQLVKTGETRYVLEIPYERMDIRSEIDIIEEIGRIYGYEQITPVQPILDPQPAQITTYDAINTIKSHLIDQGFDEVITYTFLKKGDISVVKPLAQDKAYLRTTLHKGLTDALELNFKNKELYALDVIKIFEVGHVFTDEGEKTILGIGVKSAHKKQKSKQILEDILAHIEKSTGITLGVVIADAQEVVEIVLDPILDSITHMHNSLYTLSPRPYAPFSLYPFMTRDIAVWTNASKSKADIEKIIVDLSGELLVRYDLFDEFSKDGRSSYGYRLVFQSFERTLTDDEVNPIMESIYTALKSDPDFEIR